MKNILITSAVCVSLCLGLSSCDDFLTTVPNDAPTKDVFGSRKRMSLLVLTVCIGCSVM